MTSEKSIGESLKVTTYEALALLLPGALLIEVGKRTGWIEGLGDLSTIGYGGLSYVVGLGLQGLVARPFDKLERHLGKKENAPFEALARTMVPALVAPIVSSEGLVGYCLSRVESKRASYDKFLALKDMARGLLVASTATFVSLLHQDHKTAAVLWLALTLGLVQRYVTYLPLAERSLFIQFVAGELPQPGRSSGSNRADGPEQMTEE